MKTMNRHQKELAAATEAGRNARRNGESIDDMPPRFANGNIAICTAYGDAWKAEHQEITGRPFSWDDFPA